MSRHRSRELAIQMSYQYDLDPKALSDKGSIERFWREQALSSDDNRAYFELLITGVSDYLPQIDKHIESVLQNWRMDRMEKVDLAVLRVGAYELLYGLEKIDDAVIIDEAINLAKKFGTEDSPAFVNGVLDAMAKKKVETLS